MKYAGLFGLAAIAAASGCAPLIFGDSYDPNHALGPNRAHEVHHGRGSQEIQYATPQVRRPGQQIRRPTSGLKIARGSTHVGDPAALMRVATDNEIRTAHAEADLAQREMVTRELEACAERLRAGHESVTCTVVNITASQERMFRVVAELSGGGYLLPYGGYWGAGQGYYQSRYLEDVAAAQAADQVFGGASYGASGRPLTIRETVVRHGRRIDANDRAIGQLGESFQAATGPEGETP